MHIAPEVSSPADGQWPKPPTALTIHIKAFTIHIWGLTIHRIALAIHTIGLAGSVEVRKSQAPPLSITTTTHGEAAPEAAPAPAGRYTYRQTEREP
eukprot:8825684-Pyramimonas_sp.AAC.1